ncbi:hypothetical protein [Reichenbachiella sp. MALMAid0571]|uniref:hypothetical protein n=1 Tax=Reichenbachiella sp. MALMAid0571 TaxID=3143939 RepID=UPI0032DFF91D
MPSIDFKKQLIPHAIAALVFLAVAVLFFSPVILENKGLSQYDILQWEGAAKEIIDYREKTGEEALWTNSMFGGMPAYLISTVFSGDLVVYVQKALSLWLPSPVNLVFLCFVGFYIMMIAFRVRSWLAIPAALAFGLTGFVIIAIGAGHNIKIAAVAFMPLVIAGIHLAYTRNRLWGFILTSLGLALELRVNHLQITYYLLLIALIYGLSRLVIAIMEKEQVNFAKTTGILIVAALLAVGANIGRLWTVYEYGPYSIRGKSELTSTEDAKTSGLDKDYAFQYSNGIAEPIFLFIPNFFGGASQQDLGSNSNLEKALQKNGMDRRQIKSQVENAPAYWGDQPLTAPYYGGAVVVFLFVLGLFVLDKKVKYWILGAFVLGIVLSWGSNFSSVNYFLFDYLPGYNKFRSVTFAIVIAVFAMILGGFLGLEKMINDGWSNQLQKKFLMAVGITGGFALLTVLLAGMGSFAGPIDQRLAGFPDWYLPALRADRLSLLRMDALRSLFYVLASAAILWLYFKGKVKLNIALVVVGVLVFLDMFLVDKRFIDSDSFKRNPHKTNFTPNAADQQILKDKSLSYRVYNLLGAFNDARTSYFHQSIGGYHGAKMRRYQDLIEFGITSETSTLISGLQSGSPDFRQSNVINMLNTKYFVAGDQANAVIANPEANGNAWYVSEIRKVSGADEEMKVLNEINTKSTAVVDTTLFKTNKSKYSAANIIQLIEQKPNYLKYETNCFEDGFAVFSEVYYPTGWIAKIDDMEVDILRVNYILRGLEVAKGNHLIEFEFKPDSYYIGNKIMLFFNVVILLVFVGGVYLSVKKS